MSFFVLFPCPWLLWGFIQTFPLVQTVQTLFHMSSQGYFAFHSPSKSLGAGLAQVLGVSVCLAEKSLDISVQVFMFSLM